MPLFNTQEKIICWLNEHNIKRFSLVEDSQYGYVVNVNHDVILGYQQLSSIDVKFNEIKGIFDCSANKLKNLDFAPNIVHDSFHCKHNLLTSLKNGPSIVKGYFDCSYNQLVSLEHCPIKINNDFSCEHNNLSSLKFSPTIVYGKFNCSYNKIVSLEYCPEIIHNDFICSFNNIKDLIFAPKEVHGVFCGGSNPKIEKWQSMNFNDVFQEHTKQRQEYELLLLKKNLENLLLKKDEVLHKIKI